MERDKNIFAYESLNHLHGEHAGILTCILLCKMVTLPGHLGCIAILSFVLLSPVAGGGRYWTETTYLNSYTTYWDYGYQSLTVYEYEVKIHLYVDSAVNPTWYIGPQLSCDCFDSAMVCHIY